MKILSGAKAQLSPKLVRLVDNYQDTYNGREARDLRAAKDQFPATVRKLRHTTYYRGLSLPKKLVYQFLTTGSLQLAVKHVSAWDDFSLKPGVFRNPLYSPFFSAANARHFGVLLRLKDIDPKAVIYNAAMLDPSQFSSMFHSTELVLDGASKAATSFKPSNLAALMFKAEDLDEIQRLVGTDYKESKTKYVGYTMEFDSKGYPVKNPLSR